MEFKERKITVNRHQVSYFDEGKRQALPVVFIHGFPFSKAMWNNQLEALKKDYRPIAYDVRGHGQSDMGRDDFSIDLFADDLLALLDELKIPKALVCGLSMGGYIVLNAIQKQPNRFAGLVLTDTQCGADTSEGRDKRMKTIAFIKKNGLEVYAGESLKNLFAEESFQMRKEEVEFIHQTILATPTEVVCQTLQALADRKETCSYLPKIKIPVCIMVGEEDKITPLPMAEKMAAGIKQAQVVVVKGAGHLSSLERTDQFNHVLMSFLNACTTLNN